MSEFVKSPMDYERDKPTHPRPPGKYNGDSNFPSRTSSPNAVPEKTFENWPVEKGEAVGSPVIKTPSKG